MPVSPSAPLFALFLGLTLTLSGCESAEDRAEARYQSGLELVEDGDVDRAIVELRSVFDLNPSHQEARRTLARLLLNEKDQPQQAYGQFLRLAEQYPEDLEARVVLSEIAFIAGNWEELERHGAKAEELSPDDEKVRVITMVRAYRAAVQDEDNAARRAQARVADTLLKSQPDSFVLRNVRIDDHLREGAFKKALSEVDWLLEQQPDNLRFWRQRLNILAQLQDFEALEAQLLDMVARFDEDVSHKATLVRYYMSRQEIDKAEAFLRDLAATSDEIGPRLDLVRFMSEVKGIDAARAEVRAALAETPDEPRLKVIGAGLDFEAGQRDTAIATLEEVLAAEPEADFINDVRVTLAQMLLTTGNEVGARAQVEATLGSDPGNANALKMQAAWLIEADDTDAAIAALRTALDTAPEDAAAMSLMAQAYIRSGRPTLARDFLALAVEASGNAPAETVRFARLLISEERYLPAEDILLPALRLAPQNVELLRTMGQLYLGMDDLGRVEQVAQALRQLEDPNATLAANGLEAERINRQSGPESAMQFLEQMAGGAESTLATKFTLVRARLATGDAEGALTLAREIATENPDSPAASGVLASVEAVNGNLDAAEAIYDTMLENNPALANIWLEMSRIKVRQGEPDAARAVIAEGLQALPDEPNLLWATASNHEQDGKIDDAIAIYEDLYARNTNSVVVANNLASMISTYKDDEESLERAWTIARRLRDVDVPAFQDTFGWIVHRRGNSEEALPYLEAAVMGLPQDPLVHFHLAEAYRALGRMDAALTSYRTALSVAGPTDSRPQIAKAREQVQALEAATSE